MALAPFPLPVSLEEARANFGWTEFDVILVTGDAYIDHPAFGAGIIGRWLEHLGCRVGIISQPDWRSTEDFKKLGKPKLFFGVTAGNVDSQLSRLTVMRRPRREDHYTPGAVTGKRPDMATVVYSQRLREAFKGECPPIVIGGVEASLRRMCYYDYWSDKVKRPVILDAKADVLVFGQAEYALQYIVEAYRNGVAKDGTGGIDGIPGTSIVRKKIDDIPRILEVPSGEEVMPMTDEGREKFAWMFRKYHLNCDPQYGRPVAQKHGDRYVVIYPPAPTLSTEMMDEIYGLPFTRKPHPSYGGARIPCYDMIKDSITTHRGCYADCSFCAITYHQGVAVASRSQNSVLREIEDMTTDPAFRGTISDLGGPTANMYGTHCKLGRYRCHARNCLTPTVCEHLNTDHSAVLDLMQKARQMPKVKHAFIQSGIRFDLALSEGGKDYIDQLTRFHVSGRLKIAPEHTHPEVLRHMKKPGADQYKEFLKEYAKASCSAGKDQYTVQYFISGHPGSKLEHMIDLALFLKGERLNPEQVQDFYPAPLTLGMAMWHCGRNPMTGEDIYVAKTAREKRLQRALFFFRDPDYWPDVREALREAGREDLIGHGPEFLVPPETKRERERMQGGQGVAKYPGKAPPHLRGKHPDPNGVSMGRRGRENDGWGTAPDQRRRPKRYEEDHGMPKGGPGCGGGATHQKPAHAKSFPEKERVLPDGEGGALEWMS
ncbi:MAG TPA: YgiQ family radical SAM protein [Planctomycetota bacterium]|nr:YgiQ family radical SAM protein [Planctomycetota bacterium]